MVDIVRAMNWSYVSIIYEESNYGEKVSTKMDKYNQKKTIWTETIKCTIKNEYQE